MESKSLLLTVIILGFFDLFIKGIPRFYSSSSSSPMISSLKLLFFYIFYIFYIFFIDFFYAAVSYEVEAEEFYDYLKISYGLILSYEVFRLAGVKGDVNLLCIS